jgi:hypothetical protein
MAGIGRAGSPKTVRIPERQFAVAILSVDATEEAVSDTGIQLAEALASR